MRSHLIAIAAILTSLGFQPAWSADGASAPEIQVRVHTRSGRLNLREATARGGVGKVIGALPRGAKLFIDTPSLFSAMTSNASLQARESFLKSRNCHDLSALWKDFLSETRLKEVGAAHRFVKVQTISASGKRVSGLVAADFLSVRDLDWSCQDLYRAIFAQMPDQGASCALACVWKNSRPTELIHSLSAPLARLLGAGDDASAAAGDLAAQADSLCATTAAAPRAVVSVASAVPSTPKAAVVAARPLEVTREPSARSEEGSPVGFVPPVLSDGNELYASNTKKMEKTVHIQCDDPRLSITDIYKGCKKGGELMGTHFYESVFESHKLESCVREASSNFQDIHGSENIALRMLELYDNRTTAGGGFSHHSTASAMDLSGVNIGKHHFDHWTDYKARKSSPNWKSFWLPFISCLDQADSPILTVNVLQEIDETGHPGLHFNHVHVAAP